MTAVAFATESGQRHHEAWTGSLGATTDGRASRIEALATSEAAPAMPSTPSTSTAANDADISQTSVRAAVAAHGATLFSIPRYPAVQTRAAAFVVLAEWEGSVLHLADDHFVAALVGIKGTALKEEYEAEIPWAEVSDDDRSLATLGALFRLSVGFEVQHGTRSRYSRLVFRRLPAWTRRELDAADTLALELSHAISVE